MNKILVEVSVGELLDKISILEIKKDKIKDPEKLEFIKNELSLLREEFKNNVKSDSKIDKMYQSLKIINLRLWTIEDDKRKCEKEKDFTENFIKLSRDVHILNDDRAKIKLDKSVTSLILKASCSNLILVFNAAASISFNSTMISFVLETMEALIFSI